jgi:hypothetical protein
MTMHKDAMTSAAAFLDTLTTPDKEDWTVIPFRRNRLWVSSLREYTREGQRVIEARCGSGNVYDFKKTVEALSANHDLGLVNLMFTSDHKQMGSVDLLRWLKAQAEVKHFSVVSMRCAVTAAQAVDRAKDYMRLAGAYPQPLH